MCIRDRDWSAHEVIQTGAIGEFMSLDGIEWRSSAESASGDIAFDDALWKRIFSETNTFLKDSYFTSDDISVDINTATQDVYKRQGLDHHRT